jgi:hypothetical protein
LNKRAICDDDTGLATAARYRSGQAPSDGVGLAVDAIEFKTTPIPALVMGAIVMVIARKLGLGANWRRRLLRVADHRDLARLAFADTVFALAVASVGNY